MSKADRPGDSETQGGATGYAKPPVKHRFKKGASGNPSGRRKAAVPISKPAERLSISEMVLEEAYRPVQILENGELKELPLIQAVIRTLGHSAVKGNLRAQLSIAGLVRTAQERAFENQSAVYRGAVELKAIWQEKCEANDRAGDPRPDPVPHPDDIAVDARTLAVRFNGPLDEGQKVEWDLWQKRKVEAEEDLLALRANAIAHPELAADYEEESIVEQWVIDFVARTFPDDKRVVRPTSIWKHGEPSRPSGRMLGREKVPQRRTEGAGPTLPLPGGAHYAIRLHAGLSAFSRVLIPATARELADVAAQLAPRV